jgi:Uma2 family endonuclease
MSEEPKKPVPQATIAATAYEPTLPTDLPETDGEPLESDWHRAQINLLIEVIRHLFRNRKDFFAGGNMFLYYSTRQVRNRDYRGPDFFYVKNVDGERHRRYWAVWEEDGRYPDVIVELLSPTTAEVDRTTKKQLYERVFRTREYFLYDPDTQQLEGWRLDDHQAYQPIPAGERGWLWSEVLGLWLGVWGGQYLETDGAWLRFFDAHTRVVLAESESEKQRADAEKQRADAEKQRADSEKQRADAEKQRADAALAEKERLLRELEALRQRLPQQGTP